MTLEDELKKKSIPSEMPFEQGWGRNHIILKYCKKSQNSLHHQPKAVIYYSLTPNVAKVEDAADPPRTPCHVFYATIGLP